jgi:hypothetical protein
MFEPITPLKSELNNRSSSDETLTANEEIDDEENKNENCVKNIKSNFNKKNGSFKE